jgi:hypothetical protein
MLLIRHISVGIAIMLIVDEVLMVSPDVEKSPNQIKKVKKVRQKEGNERGDLKPIFLNSFKNTKHFLV